MSIKQNKKPTISQLYQVGDFIDAKDNQGDWRVGYIVQKNQITKIFKIRFDGWVAKYDELYKFGHPKLRQFRTIVSGYTGQKQNPAVRQAWKFSLNEHEKKLTELYAYVSKNTNQNIKSAHQFNQWIRGRNYLYVDFLMTVSYSTLQEVSKVIQFFQINISLVIKYMKQISSNFEKFLAAIDRKDEAFLQDIQIAKFCSYYQLFDMMYTISGSYTRLSSFFKNHQELLRHVLASGQGDKDIKKTYQIKMIQFFLKNQGFDIVNQLLKQIDQSTKPLPYHFLHSFAHLYSGVSCVVQPKAKQNIIKQFKKIVQKSLQLLQDKQMKDFHHYQSLDLIQEIVGFSSRTSIQKDINQWSELMQLQVYFKMITCPYFQKKLKGITALHQYIQLKSQLIQNNTIQKWISKKNLFELLFSNDNPQLIKKSTQLIKLLYNKDNNMQKYIQLLWKYRKGKHETALKQIYNFMGEVPIYDRNQQFTIELFNNHLSEVSQNQWDIDYIKMIKDYTLNALFSIRALIAGHEAVGSKTSPPALQKKTQTFGFKIIYSYLQKNQSDANILNYLIQILQKLQKTQFLANFITQCFIKIQKNINSSFHQKLLLKIFKQKIIDINMLEIDPRTIIQQDIILWKNVSNNNVLPNQQSESNIQQKFQLYNEVLNQYKQIIQKDNFIHFWNQMISSKSKKQFFKWLYKLKDSGKVIITKYLNIETKKYLLENFWNSEYLKANNGIDPEEAVFLLELFKNINNHLDKIKRNYLLIQVLESDLLGLNKIHRAYEMSTNPKTNDILSKGLAEIYMSGGEELLQTEGISLVHLFISNTTNQIIKYTNQNNLQGTIKMIRLLQQLILRDEQIYDISPVIRTFSLKQYQVKNLDTNQQRFVKYNIAQIAYNFKKVLSQKFSLQMHRFDIITNLQTQQIIQPKNYFKSLGQLQVKGPKLFIKLRQNQSSQVKQQLNHHLELLFQLLGNKQIQQKIWNIVSKLPISNELRTKILQNEHPLSIIKQNNSLYKELYICKVILSFDSKLIWWNKEKIQDIIGYFLEKLRLTEFNTEIERQFVMVCGKILEKICTTEQIKNRETFLRLFLETFSTVKLLLNKTNKIQTVNILYVKKYVQSVFLIADSYNKFLDKNGMKAKELDAFSLMLNDKKIGQFFRLCLIQYRHESLRKQFPIKLVKISQFNKQNYCQKIAQIILTNLLDFCTQFEIKKNLRQFTSFASFTLESRSKFLNTFYQKNGLLFYNKLFDLIKKESPQQNSQTQNISLNCYITLIRQVISEIPATQLQKLFQYLYEECLFKGNLSKCKTKETRVSIFSLLFRIVKIRKNYKEIIQKIQQLQKNGIWRSRKLEDWVITQNQRLKSSTGYTGLRNLGCICYMNSFFQQIFMIDQFRYSVLHAQDPAYKAQQIGDNVFYQVKKMFLNLLYSDKKAYNPKSFCVSFKDYEGNPTNVSQQMDIDQFSGILFDRLEHALKPTKYKSLIKDTFGGVFSNQIICKDCPHFSQSQQNFLSLSLTVKDKKSVYESLQTMIKGDNLDGDNAYHCQRCDKKVSAVKRVCLKSLPNYLIVTLKRFQFDFNTMTKLKVNEYCEFPHQINLQQYSYEYLRKKQNPKAFQGQQLKSKKYYEYKLKGVVIHLGYADSGHYYSLIQQRTGQQRWLEFNDTIVRKFNIQNLNDQAFGGQTGGMQSKQKIKNAYMLIYERIQKQKVPTNQFNYFPNTKQTFKAIQMYKQIFSTLDQQNRQHNIQTILFSGQYNRFINNLIDQMGRLRQLFFKDKSKQSSKIVQEPELDLAGNNLKEIQMFMSQVEKFILSTFFTVLIRSKADPGTFELVQKIYTSFGKDNYELNEWILEQFCDLKIYEEFLRNCPLRETKKIIANWLVLVFKQCSNDTIKTKFLKTVLDKITSQNQNTIQPLTLLHSLIISNDLNVRKFCLQKNLIGRLLQNVIRRQQRLFANPLFTPEELRQRSQHSSSQSFFGYQKLIQKSAFQLKKLKYQNDSGIVFALIYKIISFYDIRTLKQQILTEQQFSYLYLNKDKIFKLLQELKSKFEIEVFTDYLAYLAYDNDQFNQDLIFMIQKGIKQFQSKRYRQFFVLFSKLLNINDSLHESRMPWIHNVLRSLRQNQKYAMDCTIIQLWICKIVNQNEDLRRYLMQEKQILGYLSCLPLNKIPSDELSKKNKSFGDNAVNIYHGIPFPTSRKGYIRILKQVQQFYQNLLKLTYEPINLFQSGPHCVYENLQIGQKIAYFDTRDKINYEQSTIKDIFLQRLYISRKSQAKKPFWIWLDDEKLTTNLKAIRPDNQNDQSSSKTTQMEDQIDFDGAI